MPSSLSHTVVKQQKQWQIAKQEKMKGTSADSHHYWTDPYLHYTTAECIHLLR